MTNEYETGYILSHYVFKNKLCINKIQLKCNKRKQNYQHNIKCEKKNW